MKELQARVEVLTSEEIQVIHRSSLRILERVGVRVPHEDCLARCARAGAKVDESSGVVRLPAGLMEEVLQRFRGQPEADLPDRKVAPLTGVISTQVYLVDYATQTRRLGSLDDVRKGIALVQHLSNFPTANAVVVPSDVGTELADIVCFQLIYSYSKKPGGTYVLTPFSAKHVVSMAQVMDRSVWFLLDPVSPLQFRRENIEIASIFARAGQPLYIGSMVMAGATGPVTLAGTLSLHNAELLATLFLVHALTQEYRYDIYNSGPHTVDPRTMICSFGSPNQALFGICMAQLGRFYGIRRVANVGLTDSLRPDFQCGIEKAVSAVFGSLAGIQTIGCQGLVGADQGFSYEQLVLDNEWMEFYNFILRGVEVTEETIAADVIEAIGIGGNFLGEEHTAKNFRKSLFQSKLLNRQDWETWIADGGKDTLARAHDYVGDMTANYRAALPVCTAQQFDELARIVVLARKELQQS
jgi:trimethylamine--corrinoid protein Co-methyltransferase